MKETITYCDLCKSIDNDRIEAEKICVICNRDCCTNHAKDVLPSLKCVNEPNARVVCASCVQTVLPSGTSFPSIPSRLLAELTRWQDDLVAHARASIAEKTLTDNTSTEK